MRMNYYKAEDVSRKKGVDFVKLIHDNHDKGEEDYSLALLRDSDNDKCKWVGVRWNIRGDEHDDPAKKEGKTKCLGFPTSHGHPTWFDLPEDLFKNKLLQARINKMV